VQPTASAKKGMASQVSMTLTGQKWMQMPQRLQRDAEN
jgi:hypothetical protein